MALRAVRTQRAVLRGYITKNSEDVPDPIIMEDKIQRLFDLDEKVLELLEDASENDIEAEAEGIERYRELCLKIRKKLPSQNESTTNKLFKLPELKVQSFDGQVGNWIAFWSQYKKIHEDDSIPDEDKFLYLFQFTQGRARKMLSHFPASASNYHKAIDLLTERFGRKEILIDFYVRKLLKLMISQLMKERIPLSELYEKVCMSVFNLEALGLKSDEYAALILPMIESALPATLLKDWERKKKVTECSNPDLSENDNDSVCITGASVLSNILEFLKAEVDSDEKIKFTQKSLTDFEDIKKIQNSPGTAGATTGNFFNANNNPPKCIFCLKIHKSQNCRQNNTLQHKREAILKNKLCYSCLLPGHNSKNCTRPAICSKCTKNHYDILCPMNVNNDTKLETQTQQTTLQNFNCHKNVYLKTLVVEVSNLDKSKTTQVRVVCDSGSQRSYITSDVARMLNLDVVNTVSLKHCLFGGSQKSQDHNQYRCIMKSLMSNNSITCDLLDQPKICHNVARLDNDKIIDMFCKKNVMFSDVKFVKSNSVDLLLGADLLSQISTGREVKVNGLLAQETLLGWTVMGEICSNTDNVCSSFFNLTDIWELEKIGIESPTSKNDVSHNEDVHNNFVKNIKKTENNMYEVKLPWIDDTRPSNNFNNAFARLKNLNKKLIGTNKFKDYESEINNWMQAGFIEQISDEDPRSTQAFYLPHRPVYKESRTTEIRPVFDAGSKDCFGTSLNSCLEIGPNLLEHLVPLLLKFRFDKIGLASDIRKAFLMISVDSVDRDFLRFLWISSDGQLIIFRHTRVVFGVKSSPFLLNATIQYHLTEHCNTSNETVNKLTNSFYVDNCICSLDNEKEFNKFVNDSQEIMMAGNFELREWCHTIVKDASFNCCNENKCLISEGCKSVSLLGLTWNCQNDNILICFNHDLYKENLVVTKRVVLSYAQRIFDPLGMVAAVTLIPKLILQDCWKNNYDWDVELPLEMRTKFLKWIKQLHFLSKCELPRCLVPVSGEIQLHAFADSSKSAFGCCVFIRSQVNGEVYVRLAVAKSRVCPKKEMSIARLELVAAVLSCRLLQTVKESLNLREAKTFYWTDSSIVLCWIKNKGPWKVFIKNRIKEILSVSTPNEWHHIQGDMNPADLVSRGSFPKQFVESNWISGPKWLYLPNSEWPNNNVISVENSHDEINEESSIDFLNVNDVGQNEVLNLQDLFSRFSSYTKTLRMLAWIFRFAHKCTKKSYTSGELLYSEVCSAELKVLKLVQFESLNETVLTGLEYFKDTEGLLRLKTRLQFSKHNADFKTPIILHGKHHTVQSLMLDYHLRNNHAGVQTLMVLLREKYWILKCRKYLKQIVKSCVTCRRHAAKAVGTPVAPLPAKRINDAKSFQNSGCDLAGPLVLRDGSKAWVVLFCCAVYRAVHLEVVQSLSTESFIMALRRFVARRGRVQTIFCDNGTNFTGLSNKLEELDWDEILRYSTTAEINFCFSPPSAPWWGGMFERLIRVMKELLRKVLRKACITLEELFTVLADIECTINSRPLTYVYDSNQELEPLTPACFIQDITVGEVPDLDLIDQKFLNKRTKYLQTLREILRKRFQEEYIGQLSHYFKHPKNLYELQVGDIVLVHCDNIRRQFWPLAKIIELIKGKDNVVRVAKLKTHSGELVRHVHKLIPLEITATDVTESVPLDEPVVEPEDPDDIFEETSESVPLAITTRRGRVINKPARLDL